MEATTLKPLTRLVGIDLLERLDDEGHQAALIVKEVERIKGLETYTERLWEIEVHGDLDGAAISEVVKLAHDVGNARVRVGYRELVIY